MTCPNCNKALTITTRQGVDFESCTDCGGFWLTPMEMDRVLSRTPAHEARLQAPTISPLDAESISVGEDYATYAQYKYHGCYGHPKNIRWAQKLSTKYALA